MSKMYGSYSDDDLNDWERLPLNAMVLTSSAMGAWLKRRDENKRKQENTDVLDKIKAEIDQMPSELNEYGRRMIKRESVFQIIDKYRKKSEGKNEYT